MFNMNDAAKKEELLLGKWTNVLSSENHGGKSRYKHIPTMKVANFFREKGWIIRTVTGSGSLANHLVRMVHPAHKIGEDQLEILIKNSYDGRSKLNVSLGIYRFVCSNGLVVGETFESITQKHIGKNIEMELENKYEKLVAQASKLSDMVKKMKETIVKVPLKLVEKIAIETIGKKKGEYSVNTEDIMKPLREEDEGKDLWSIMNVVQEKVINGGISFILEETDEDNKTVLAHKTTKKRSNIYKNMALNQLIFNEFEKLAA